MTSSTDENGNGTNEDGSETEECCTHLEGIDDGCGCAEIWEELSEKRIESNVG